jgi:hypothetical protein
MKVNGIKIILTYVNLSRLLHEHLKKIFTLEQFFPQRLFELNTKNVFEKF